jgi:hypothetical protein
MPINRSCLQCTDLLKTSMTRRLFCSERCERDFWHDHRYECYYCGEPSDTEDHIFPQTYGNGAGETLPACTECNSTLQHFSPTSHINRMKLLKQELEGKYAEDLKRPAWTENDLREIGRGMQQWLEADRASKLRAETRLAFLSRRIDETVQAQDDLDEVGTEIEDYEVDVEAFGYRPKDIP